MEVPWSSVGDDGFISRGNQHGIDIKTNKPAAESV